MRRASGSRDEQDRKGATVYDVARVAGVSIKTVSRVVNQETGVRPQTRSRVQSAIDKLDYQVNRYARHLATLRNRASADAKTESV